MTYIIGIFPCGHEANQTVTKHGSKQMSKRGFEDFNGVIDPTCKKGNMDKTNLIRILQNQVDDPGHLALVIDRKGGALAVMFTQDLTSKLSPSKSSLRGN